MHVISTWSAPSAVYHSEKLDPTTLVIAKSTRIELVKLLEDGLRHLTGIDLGGQITSLNVFGAKVCYYTACFLLYLLMGTLTFMGVIG